MSKKPPPVTEAEFQAVDTTNEDEIKRKENQDKQRPAGQAMKEDEQKQAKEEQKDKEEKKAKEKDKKDK